MSTPEPWHWWQLPVLQSNQDRVDFNIAFQSALWAGVITSILSGIFIVVIGWYLTQILESRVEKSAGIESERRSLANVVRKVNRLKNIQLHVYRNAPLRIPEELLKIEGILDNSGLLGNTLESRNMIEILDRLTNDLNNYIIDRDSFELTIYNRRVFNNLGTNNNDYYTTVVYMMMLGVTIEDVKRNFFYFPEPIEDVFEKYSVIAAESKTEFNLLLERKQEIYKLFTSLFNDPT